MRQSSGSSIRALALLRFSGCSGLALALALLRSGSGLLALCLQQPVRDGFAMQLCITQGSLQLRKASVLGTAPGSAISRSAARFAAPAEPNMRLVVWMTCKLVEVSVIE